jgi:hypothetical protein
MRDRPLIASRDAGLLLEWMTMVRRLLISLSAALALSVAACGGGDEPDDAAAPVATPTAAIAQASPPPAEPSIAVPPATTPPPATSEATPNVVQPSAPGQPSTSAPPTAELPTVGVTDGTEPNDSPKEANGPASSTGFQSIVDLPNDADWFYWRVKAGRTVDINAQHVEGDCSQTFLFFTEGPEGQIFSTDKVSVSPGGELPETGSYSAPNGKDGYVLGRLQGDDDDNVGGAVGCRLRATLSPADAVIETPSPGDAAFLATIDD